MPSINGVIYVDHGKNSYTSYVNTKASGTKYNGKKQIL
jgi:hypothetical protein